jgi:membrane-bound lytic murein transglycosylase D
MLKKTKFSSLMSIRAHFTVSVGCLVAVCAAGAGTFAAADPYPRAPIAPEEAAVPPQPDDLGRPDPESAPDASAERPVDASGSGGKRALTVEDPWAEAVAEAMRRELQGEPEPTALASGLEPYEVVVNDQIQRFVDHYTGSRREIIGLWLSRSGRYLDMIREVFRAQGLPEDLAFMAMVESGFNPVAVSRAGAKGLWQFMAATARRYGLRVDHWVDERLDPVKSTNAAAAYLRDLYRQFGSWALVKAAYNAGESKVVRAIRAVGTTDFWALAQSRFLRVETKQFVPAVQAATLIGRDPARYGFEPVTSADALTATMDIPGGTNLRILASVSGIPYATLRQLNPVLIRGIAPPGGSYELTVREDDGERIVGALATMRTGGRRLAVAVGTHVVQPRETLVAIAKRYGIAVADVLRWNKLQNADLIRPGDRLRVVELLRATAEPARAATAR